MFVKCPVLTSYTCGTSRRQGPANRNLAHKLIQAEQTSSQQDQTAAWVPGHGSKETHTMLAMSELG